MVMSLWPRFLAHPVYTECMEIRIYSLSPETSIYYFFEYLCLKLTDFNDFWYVKSRENFTWNLTYLSTSRVRVYIEKTKKVIFNSVIHTYFWLFTLALKKTNWNPIANSAWKCHHTNLWNAKLFLWLKVCCVLSNVGSSDKSQLLVVISALEKNPL